MEGIGFALLAAVASVGILAGVLLMLNLPRSSDVLLVNIIAPALAAVVGIFPAHWIVNSPRFRPHTRVWWATLGIIIWAIIIAIVTYILGAQVARQSTDALSAPTTTIATQLIVCDSLPGFAPIGRSASGGTGPTTYDSAVLLFRDEQAWLIAVRDPAPPRGFRTMLVPTVEVIAVTGVD